jgi:hypothetical protein
MTCRQGLHEKCKSKKYAPRNEHGVEAQMNIVKVLTELFQNHWGPGGMPPNQRAQDLGLQYEG